MKQKKVPKHKVMTLTKEQKAILCKYKSTAGNMKVLALAGTGKTTTLLSLCSDNTNVQFCYLAFNRDIKQEVQSKIKKTKIYNLNTYTHNSFCFNIAKREGILPQTCRPVPKIRLKDIRSHVCTKYKKMDLAGHVRRTVERFLITNDAEISEFHISPRTKERLQEKFAGNISTIIQNIVSMAKTYFKTIDANCAYVPHDVYVKLVQLHCLDPSPPNVDTILLDEAQDINPVFASIVSKMKCRVIAVGDSHQAIYQFRGAFNYLQKMEAETTLTLTKSFRYVPEIAHAINILLSKGMSLLRAEGFQNAVDRGKRAIICRTNSGCIQEALVLDEKGILFHLDATFKNQFIQDLRNLRFLSECRNDLIGDEDLKRLTSVDQIKEAAHDGLIDEHWVDTHNIVLSMGGFEQAEQVVHRLSNNRKRKLMRSEDTIITTAHKSKGKSYGSVTIGSDFHTFTPFEEKTIAEKNLVYVACSRAEVELVPGALWKMFGLQDSGSSIGKLVKVTANKKIKEYFK